MVLETGRRLTAAIHFMNSIKNRRCLWLQNLTRHFAPTLLVAGVLFSALHGQAQGDYTPLNVWSFQDQTNWTSDYGTSPVSFSNLDFSYLGNGSSLVVSTDAPAWLQFNITEADGSTNLTLDTGTVSLWFAPSWSGTNVGGTGPGVAARLLEVGGYTDDSSLGWWSLYTDEAGANLFFSAQTNDLSSNVVTYLSVPIAWTTNYFHNMAVTYSATNTALYLDGELVTNGLPLTVFPSGDVLTNGFFIGSGREGMNQAHGMFNTLMTYAEPLDAATMAEMYDDEFVYYLLSPVNGAMFHAASGILAMNALSQPSSSPAYFNIISGAGYLQFLGDSASCVTSSNVWLTNVSATVVSQPLTFNFDIAGGIYGGLYDVFATPALTAPLTNGVWTWLGQGPACNRYLIPNLPTSGNLFFLLGTAVDGDGDGLTDAYERLVSHSDPTVMDTDLAGLPDGWQVLHFGGIGNNPNSDPDHDGLMNRKEYLYGTDPQVSEGVAVWVAPIN